MSKLLKELAQAATQRGQVESVDPFAFAMLLHDSSLVAQLRSDTPLLVQRDPQGWTAAFWLKIDDQSAGQRLVVARGCRTAKLARIAGNYFRLHQAINQINA
ncbi:MAG: hypothetical protein AAGJ82_10930 [Bacteroidota bacterium]